MQDTNHIVVDPTVRSIYVPVDYGATDPTITCDRAIETHHGNIIFNSFGNLILIVEEYPSHFIYGPSVNVNGMILPF